MVSAQVANGHESRFADMQMRGQWPRRRQGRCAVTLGKQIACIHLKPDARPIDTAHKRHGLKRGGYEPATKGGRDWLDAERGSDILKGGSDIPKERHGLVEGKRRIEVAGIAQRRRAEHAGLHTEQARRASHYTERVSQPSPRRVGAEQVDPLQSEQKTLHSDDREPLSLPHAPPFLEPLRRGIGKRAEDAHRRDLEAIEA